MLSSCSSKRQNKKDLILLFEEMESLQCKQEFWSAFSPMLEDNDEELEEAENQSRKPNFPNILRGVIGVGVHRIVRDSDLNSTTSPPNKKRDFLVPHFTPEQVNEYLWQPAERDYHFKSGTMQRNSSTNSYKDTLVLPVVQATRSCLSSPSIRSCLLLLAGMQYASFTELSSTVDTKLH
jgi:hypothetical protein